jgi:2'-5' RNA ligase
VRFNDEALTVIPFETDIENVGDLWFTSAEYQHIKRRNKLCLQLERSGSFKESENNTFYGLEKQTMLNRLQRKLDRASVLRNNLL